MKDVISKCPVIKTHIEAANKLIKNKSGDIYENHIIGFHLSSAVNHYLKQLLLDKCIEAVEWYDVDLLCNYCERANIEIPEPILLNRKALSTWGCDMKYNHSLVIPDSIINRIHNQLMEMFIEVM